MRFAVALFAAAAVVAPSWLRAQPTGVLNGIVREDGTGQFIAGVDVILPGFKLRATTDAGGRYSIANIPAGPTLLVGKKFGWEELSAAVKITAATSNQFNFALTPAVKGLDTMRVVGITPENNRALDLFAQHRIRGFGSFFDSTDIRRRELAKLSDFLQGVTGVTVVQPPLCIPMGVRYNNCSITAAKRVAVSGNRCAMRIMRDQNLVANGGPISDTEPNTDLQHDWVAAYDITTLHVSDLIAIELYRRESDVPMEYRGGATECGLIQLWTNRR